MTFRGSLIVLCDCVTGDMVRTATSDDIARAVAHPSDDITYRSGQYYGWRRAFLATEHTDANGNTFTSALDDDEIATLDTK